MVSNEFELWLSTTNFTLAPLKQFYAGLQNYYRYYIYNCTQIHWRSINDLYCVESNTELILFESIFD